VRPLALAAAAAANAHGRPVPAWKTVVSSICGQLVALHPSPSPASLAAVIGQSAFDPSPPNTAHPAVSQHPCASATRRTDARSDAVTTASSPSDAPARAAMNPA
jgi:hypothetical protein